MAWCICQDFFHLTELKENPNNSGLKTIKANLISGGMDLIVGVLSPWLAETSTFLLCHP